MITTNFFSVFHKKKRPRETECEAKFAYTGANVNNERENIF